MRIILIITFVFLVPNEVYGQKWDKEINCSSDTVIIYPRYELKFIPENIDTTKLRPYRVISCKTRSFLGFREEIGISSYYYGKKTKEWIGNHSGPNLNYILTIDKLNFGFRFKPWTVNPKKEMNFNGQILTSEAELNPIKLDFYIGYSYDLNFLISVEPYLGYNRSLSIIINENEINQSFEISKTGGMIIGSTVNKYFRIKEYSYITISGSFGYGFVDYEKINSDLDNGYFEWNLGIALKSYAIKRFYKRID